MKFTDDCKSCGAPYSECGCNYCGRGHVHTGVMSDDARRTVTTGQETRPPNLSFATFLPIY